jgi:poly(A) polymerase
MANSEVPQSVRKTFPDSSIDPDAMAVVQELQDAGFETYLVGGCVRDLLLGRKPKDFDIATTATPRQLRRQFRNCRIIGRRFRLAHILFGPKILEVATFRGRAAEALMDHTGEVDEVIERTNTFGTPDQDARSRDFTINGLFYDPVGRQIIDHVGGMPDVEARQIRTIGDPRRRLEEDPVRILRAVKFSARLDFSIERSVSQAMTEFAELISHCPPPRVTEEILRITESGHAAKAYRIMFDLGVLHAVLPEIDTWLRGGDAQARAERMARFIRTLEVLDHSARAHGGCPREIVLIGLFWPLAWAEARRSPSSRKDWGDVIEEWFRPIGVRMHIPIRMRSRFSAHMSVLQRLLVPSKTPRKARAFIQRDHFGQALALLRMHYRITGEGRAAYDTFGELAASEGILASTESYALRRDADDGSPEPTHGDSGPAPRRRRRSGRRSR